MSNGLDNLDNRRKTRKARTPPPPLHPRSQQADTPEAESAPPATQSDAAPAEARPASPRSDATRTGRSPSVEAYLDQDLLDWLWDVEGAAVARRQRNLISPVVRLALRELRKRMTPEQVVARVLNDAQPHTGRKGRPRR
ncbi:hypothetical protein EMG21_27585 [Klebsiella pneumoniae]|nr:hypothetical protein EMG21_27585 [Klebsiella pneumoniae]